MSFSRLSIRRRKEEIRCLLTAFVLLIGGCQNAVLDENSLAVNPDSGSVVIPEIDALFIPPITLPEGDSAVLVVPVYQEAGVCASSNAEAGLLPVYLAFAFDVSGSMGLLDEPYHDPKLKWDPVVAATKAFFTSPSSTGLAASMTFFPSVEPKCDDLSYLLPNVPFTPLPSTEFGRVLDEYRQQRFRGSTPTIHVMRGILAYVQAQREVNPGRYVIVMVTDGIPQGCASAENNIPSVVSLVKSEFIPKDLPVYVVGVKNPPSGPDSLKNLGDIAVAGGTQKAYIIDTGDPAKTTADLKETIEKIRGYSISCDLKIPAPQGGYVFDKQKVAVSYNRKGTVTQLTYDATCQNSNGWQYDNPADPKQIKLCTEVCKAIQDDSTTKINIEFTCDPVIVIPF
jgi:hypothetical protein